MKFQTSALLLLAASIDAFSPVSTPSRTSVALNAGEGLNVDLPSIESQVSLHNEYIYCTREGLEYGIQIIL